MKLPPLCRGGPDLAYFHCACVKSKTAGSKVKAGRGGRCGRPFTVLGECSLAWSVDPSLSLREQGARSDIPGKQTHPYRAHMATKSHFPSVLSTSSPLIGPNFLPGHVLRLNSTRVGQHSEVENHQLDLLRGGEKSRTRRFFFFIKMVCAWSMTSEIDGKLSCSLMQERTVWPFLRLTFLHQPKCEQKRTIDKRL